MQHQEAFEVTIQIQVVRHMETLNKYLGVIPTIKNSPLAVASMEPGNIPFNETTLASIIIIFSNLPLVWRDQYNLTHSTVPESPRAMLMDLKNIKKFLVERYNNKAKATKAKAAAASKAGNRMPKKRVHGGGPDKGAQKKGHSHRFEKDGSP